MLPIALIVLLCLLQCCAAQIVLLFLLPLVLSICSSAVLLISMLRFLLLSSVLARCYFAGLFVCLVLCCPNCVLMFSFACLHSTVLPRMCSGGLYCVFSAVLP